MPQIKKPDDLQSFGFFICMTITFNDGNKSVFIFMYQSAKKMLVVSPRGLGMLIYQALHLAKSLPFTDKSSKTKALSVIGSLEKRRLRTKRSKMAVCP